MGLFGGGKSAAPAPTVTPVVTPVPPPAQIASSIQAGAGQQRQSSAAGGMGFGDTLLTGGAGVKPMSDAPLTDRALNAMYGGKKLTGA
jgi:hypothetical protein